MQHLSHPVVHLHRPTGLLESDRLLAVAACLVALAATLELLTRSYRPAAWTGLVALVLAGAAQMWSRTREERFLDIGAALLGALALGIGAAHAGMA